MVSSIATILAGAIIFVAMVYLTILESRRRGESESEERSAKAALRSREKMDDALSKSVGRRWDLVAHLKKANQARKAGK